MQIHGGYSDQEKNSIFQGISDWGDVNDVNYISVGDPDRPILTRDSGVLTVRPGTLAELTNPTTGDVAEAITLNVTNHHWLTESTMLLNPDIAPEKLSSISRYEEGHNNFFDDCHTCIPGGFFDMSAATRNSYGIPSIVYPVYRGYLWWFRVADFQ